MNTQNAITAEAGRENGAPAHVDEIPLPTRQNKRAAAKSYLSLLLVGALLVGAGVYGFTHRNQKKASQLYVVEAVARGTVAKTVTASGTLKAWQVVDIKSKAGGRVDALNVEIGDHVKKHQVIARIDPSDSLLTVLQAKTDVTSSRAKQEQSAMQYGLQVRQTVLSVQDAEAQLAAAKANEEVMTSRLKTAQDQASAQVGLTRTSILAAQANYRNAEKTRQQLDALNPRTLRRQNLPTTRRSPRQPMPKPILTGRKRSWQKVSSRSPLSIRRRLLKVSPPHRSPPRRRV